VAYGGIQPGYDDNHTDETFLEGMVMNAKGDAGLGFHFRIFMH